MSGPAVETPEAVDREEVEVDALLETVFRYYGFDFRQYARPSLRRRLWRRASLEGGLARGPHW